ncbi:MAG: CinA family protein, partial [Clostridia bacterium]|nr:CinA family protein [Clostridia bacterium]
MQERQDRLAQALLRALAARGHGMAVAESLTGGMLANALVRIPGASRVFQAGVVAYCNRAKADMLGVSAGDLTTLGAVSEPVARQMALGLSV